MNKKTIFKFALGMLVAFQLNVCSAEDYQEELTLPVGAAFDLEMDDEIDGMDYDAKVISIENRNGREVPVLKQAGDTYVTIYFKKQGGGNEPVKFLLHSLSSARYDEVTDEHGDVKPEYQEFYDKKAYAARQKKEAATSNKTVSTASKKNDNTKPTPPSKPEVAVNKPATQMPGKATGLHSVVPKISGNGAKASASTTPKTSVPPTAKTTVPKSPAITPTAPKAPAVVTTKPTTPAPVAEKSVVKAVYPENGTFTQQIAFLVNEERAKSNLQPLKVADDMQRLANIRVEEISNYYSSSRPNGQHFSTIFGSDAPGCGQAIGSGHNNARSMFASWMRNPSAHDILLDPALKELAVGHTFKENTAHKHYWVVLLRE